MTVPPLSEGLDPPLGRGGGGAAQPSNQRDDDILDHLVLGVSETRWTFTGSMRLLR